MPVIIAETKAGQPVILYTSSDGVSITTSTTYQLKAQLSILNVQIGDVWDFWWSCEVYNDTSNDYVQVRFRNATSGVTFAEAMLAMDGVGQTKDYHALAGIMRYTMANAGTNQINLEWRVDLGNGYIRRARIRARRVS